jgi:conjugal transfer pilus assembly protein TraW
MKKILVLLLCLNSQISYARDLGVAGQIWQIEEQDIVEYIKNKLSVLNSTGELKRLQHEITEKITNNIKKPKRVANIEKARITRIFNYDPTYTLELDITGVNDQVIFAAGTKVNPFEQINLSKELLFIDGEDKEQIEFAKLKPQHKLILIAGSPFDLSQQLERPVYFDQSGEITKKLGITNVPALVMQKNKFLQITELSLEDAK